VYKYWVLDRSRYVSHKSLLRTSTTIIYCLVAISIIRETPIPIPYADERLVPTTLKPYEEVNNGRVITSTRNAFEAGRDDHEVFNDEDFNARY